MIDNVDQDKWFNLYLCLGSCWVNKSRYEAWYSIRYRTQSPDLTKESRSIDRAETENLTELDTKESRHEIELKSEVREPEVLTQSWAESRRLRTRITPKPVQKSLTEEGSVRGRSLQHIHHPPDQPGSGSVVCVRCVRTDPDFSKSIFSSQITGNEVLILF